MDKASTSSRALVLYVGSTPRRDFYSLQAAYFPAKTTSFPVFFFYFYEARSQSKKLALLHVLASVHSTHC